jgi:hypothetical protein
MNVQDVFCPYEGCVDKGVAGKGNIVWWQRGRSDADARVADGPFRTDGERCFTDCAPMKRQSVKW